MRALFFITLFTFFATALFAQPAYVQGEDYKVTNRVGGPEITWNDEPARPDQLLIPSENEIRILDPVTGEERVVVFLLPDGQIRKVVDLAYSSVTESDRREQRRIETAYDEAKEKKREGLPKIEQPSSDISSNNFDTNGVLEVEFENGLVFNFANGVATAYWGTQKIEVTGKEGRYRMETTAFEAGVAFNPQTGNRVYKYLTIR